MSDGGTLALRTRVVVVEDGMDSSLELSRGAGPRQIHRRGLQGRRSGIPSELVGRVFDPYVTTKAKVRAWGLRSVIPS
jgi:nitrogen-specific signal transduction histidine kinase